MDTIARRPIRPVTIPLRMQHTSLQYKDTPKQQEHDIKLLFSKGQMYPIKTGTEAGPMNSQNRPLLIEYAEEYGHYIHFAKDNWIAVDRDIVKKGSFERDHVFIIDNDKTWGRGYDSDMATVAFDHVDERLGRINLGAVHFPTRGRTKGEPNYEVNVLYSTRIAQWMREVGAGKALAFVNGDFNIPDRTMDWAFGRAFTSMADELRAWQHTGHGPIDGFCSYDKDGRVSARRFNVLDDSESFRFSDHFVCRGVWAIEPMKF